MAARATSAKRIPSSGSKKPVRREVWGLVCLVLGLFSLIGFFIQDYWLIDGLCLYVFKGLFGWGYYIVPAVFVLGACILFRHKGRPVTARLICLFCMPLVLGALLHLFLCDTDYGFDWLSVSSLYLGGINLETGGVLSGILANFLRKAVSTWGAAPVLFIVFVALGFVAARISVRDTMDDFKNRNRSPYVSANKVAERKKKREKYNYSEQPQPVRNLPESEIFSMQGQTEIPEQNYYPPLQQEVIAAPVNVDVPELEPKTKTKGGSRWRREKKSVMDVPLEQDTPAPQEEIPEDIPPMPKGPVFIERGTPQFNQKYAEQLRNNATPESPFILDATKGKQNSALDIPADVDEGRRKAEYHSAQDKDDITSFDDHFGIPGQKKKDDVKKVTAKDREKEYRKVSRAIEKEQAEEPEDYRYPPVSLLKQGSAITPDGRDEVMANRDRLEATLHSFGIGATITEITRGPSVTRYDLELEAGVKLNKITNLAGDLALSLGVVGVRIAPIPDRIATVGVEVPNKKISTVFLRDILESNAFTSASSKLSFAIGKDIAGNCIVGNISKLPHMLIAGTTGSGKSVCMNSLILSLLYKSTPEEVRLIMIDPKMVELGIYNGIPHLYIPVVTDPKKAAGALQWAVVEMMKRYQRFSDIGVRDLGGYNKYKQSQGEDTMPNVVIVIDELADLMMTAAKEVEESICRVAQMGRAAGVHLVIATQRPSADVITGLMKANIPSRIAFAVSSSMESRIILDQQGAEKLIGMGDMLYAPLGCGKPLRVQGAFVSDEEREKVINFIKESSTADYDPNINSFIDQAAAGNKDKDSAASSDSGTIEADPDNPFAGCDDLLPDAVDIILETKQASVSMLQRRLKLGYSRAARIMDQMEELGIVGQFEGSKPRQLLITRESWEEWRLSGSKTPMEQLIEDSKDDYSGEGYDADFQ